MSSRFGSDDYDNDDGPPAYGRWAGTLKQVTYSRPGLQRLQDMECRWQVEIDPWCRRVLEKHWPTVRRYSDIKDVKGDELEPVDLIAGGFPCQPVSIAGRRLGNQDERWLWPEFFRVVRMVRPKYILVENVPGLLGGGLGEVLGDLAEWGWDATWASIPVAAFGAPHLRHRIFLVANRDSERIKGFWAGQIRRVSEFSWCEGIRRVEDLRGRSDIPEPLIRRKAHGDARRMDGCGNAVVPQVAQWIGERMMRCDNGHDSG